MRREGWRSECEALLEIKRWDLPEEEVRAGRSLLASDDIDRFIEYAREKNPSARPGVSRATWEHDREQFRRRDPANRTRPGFGRCRQLRLNLNS